MPHAWIQMQEHLRMGQTFPEDVGDNTLASLLEFFWTACCSHIKYHVSFLEAHQQQCAISLIILHPTI